MTNIKAIETSYKGYRFRSRTEARWAVYLDVIGLEWGYEVEGYVLSDGTCYLPDFEILGPGGEKFFAEVKGTETTDFEAYEKASRLAEGTGYRVLFFLGVPSYENVARIPTVLPHEMGIQLGYSVLSRESVAMQVDDGDFEFVSGDEHVLEKLLGLRPVKAALSKNDAAAVDSARGARFEFGERGAAA